VSGVDSLVLGAIVHVETAKLFQAAADSDTLKRVLGRPQSKRRRTTARAKTGNRFQAAADSVRLKRVMMRPQTERR